MWNIKSLAFTVPKEVERFKFKNPRSRSQGQHCWYLRKGLATRNTPVKYQSSSFHCSKVICKVKVSDRFMEWKNDRQDKNNMSPDLWSQRHEIRPVLNSLSDIAGKRVGKKTGRLVLYVLYISRKKIKMAGGMVLNHKKLPKPQCSMPALCLSFINFAPHPPVPMQMTVLFACI